MVAALLAGTQTGVATPPARVVPPPTAAAKAGASIALPAGTKVELALVRPVWAYSASPGTPIYAITTFPVAAGDRVAIPAGTYIQGTIEQVIRPTWRKQRAAIHILFTKIIFANGYAVELPGSMASVTLPSNSITPPQTGAQTSDAELAPTLIAVSIQVATRNDLLLDNGAAIEMTLGARIALDAAQVAADIPVSRAPMPGQFVSATRCRPTAGIPGTPGTRGTPDTVIPGSPGTPDTVIPGGPGQPDTVIPGAPATPDTVIPGAPGTPGTPDIPGTVCPNPPVVISSTPVSAAGKSGRNAPPDAKH